MKTIIYDFDNNHDVELEVEYNESSSSNGTFYSPSDSASLNLTSVKYEDREIINLLSGKTINKIDSILVCRSII